MMLTAQIFVCLQLAWLANAWSPLLKTKPVITKQYTEDEWVNLRDEIQPMIDDPVAEPIIQPAGAGKRGQFINPYIIGGSNATLGQFPWQVWVDIDGGGTCGGSLILDEWVLTAAHCVGQDHVITIGTIDRDNPSAGSVTRVPLEVIVHEHYNNVTLIHDIALFQIEKVNLTNNIKLIALPPISDANTTFQGTVATLSGFGITSIGNDASSTLQFANLTVTSQELCAASFNINGSHICTYENGTRTSCQGDSGGPLVYKNNDNTFVQIGVVSFGPENCTSAPSVYVRVSTYLGWLSNKIGQDISVTTPASNMTTPTPVTNATSSANASTNTAPPTSKSNSSSNSTVNTPPPKMNTTLPGNTSTLITTPPKANTTSPVNATMSTSPPTSKANSSSNATVITPPPKTNTTSPGNVTLITPPPKSNTTSPGNVTIVTPPPKTNTSSPGNVTVMTLPPTTKANSSSNTTVITPPPKYNTTSPGNATAKTSPPTTMNTSPTASLTSETSPPESPKTPPPESTETPPPDESPESPPPEASTTVKTPPPQTNTTVKTPPPTATTSLTKVTTTKTTTIKKSTTKKPPATKKPPKSPNCQGGNLEALVSSKCCAAGPKQLVSLPKRDKTCRANAASMKIFNSYTLNRHQLKAKNNTIQFGSMLLKRPVMKDACFVECYLSEKAKAFLDDGSLDLTAVSDFLSLNLASSDLKSDMESIVSYCYDIISGEQNLNIGDCSGLPILLVQCVNFVIIQTCPAEQRTKKGACGKGFDLFDKCSPYIMQSPESFKSSSKSKFSVKGYAANTQKSRKAGVQVLKTKLKSGNAKKPAANQQQKTKKN